MTARKPKVVSLAGERRKRDRFEAFAPAGLDDIVGCIGPVAGERNTHVSVKAPPQGSMWAFSPDQAREVAKSLVEFADYVDGPQAGDVDPMAKEGA